MRNDFVEGSEYDESSEEESLDSVDGHWTESNEIPDGPPSSMLMASSPGFVEPFTEDFIPLPSSPDLQYSDLPVPPPSVLLSEEQTEIFNLVMQGKNMFFTGSAGSSSISVLSWI